MYGICKHLWTKWIVLIVVHFDKKENERDQKQNEESPTLVPPTYLPTSSITPDAEFATFVNSLNLFVPLFLVPFLDPSFNCSRLYFIFFNVFFINLSYHYILVFSFETCLYKYKLWISKIHVGTHLLIHLLVHDLATYMSLFETYPNEL